MTGLGVGGWDGLDVRNHGIAMDGWDGIGLD